MANKEFSGFDKIILSKRNKRYKFTFQLKSKNELLIKAEEEKNDEDSSTPYCYKKLLTINDLPKTEGITIYNMNAILERIYSSFKNKKLDFDFEYQKFIKLYYYFLDEKKDEINIPFVYKNDFDIIYALSSKLSQSQKLFEKTFNKIKSLKININSANAFNIKLKNKENFHDNLFNNQKNEINNIINELKNYIKTINDKTTLNKKFSEDNFNEIKREGALISNKLDTQSSSIQQQNNNITNQITHLNNDLKVELSSIKNIINISKLYSFLDNKLNVYSSSIQDNFQQEITKKVSDLNNKINTSFLQQREESKKYFSELYNKLNLQIQNNLKQQNEEISQEISKINVNLNDKALSFEKNYKIILNKAEEINKQIKDIISFIQTKFIQIEKICNQKLVEEIYSAKNVILEKSDSINNSIQKNILQQANILSRKFTEELNSYFEEKQVLSILDSILINQINSSLNKLNIIKTIKNPHSGKISLICELKDKRLVSCSHDKSIVVYNNSYLPQIQIQNAHDEEIVSMCVLRNGDLASSSGDETIKVWRINKNDYELIQTLQGHTDTVWKVIELEDGRLCSCSSDETIKIWDNYKCIRTIIGHTNVIVSIIEMNDYIISVSCDSKDGLRIWNKSTNELAKIIQDVSCNWSINGLEKLNTNTLLIGGRNILFVVNIESSEVNKLKDNRLGYVICFKVIRNDLVLFGNEKGEICEYNPFSNKIISKSKFHDRSINCLLRSEDNILISCSNDKTIKMLKENKRISQDTNSTE